MQVLSGIEITLLTILTAGLAAALTGAVTLWTTARNIKIETVTKTRAGWRDKVRGIALRIHRASSGGERTRLGELLLELKLELDLLDPEDREILDAVRRVCKAEGAAPESDLEEFGDRLALLFRDDWKRATWEASSLPWRLWHCRPRRCKYSKYKDEGPRPSRARVTAA